MKIIDARIEWMNGFGNHPRLEVFVDKIPNHHDLKYEVKEYGTSKAYYADLGGFVNYMISNSDKRGFGGAVFELLLINGKKEEVRGPWSSRSSQMFKLFKKRSFEVSITDNEGNWKKNWMTSGCISGKLFEHTMNKFFPEVRWSWKEVGYEKEMHYEIAKPVITDNMMEHFGGKEVRLIQVPTVLGSAMTNREQKMLIPIHY